jgi:hypothetical protein
MGQAALLGQSQNNIDAIISRIGEAKAASR